MVVDGVKITERGWAGHLAFADSCKFRRNTLLEYNDKKWVVSTVGAMPQPEMMKRCPELRSENGFETIGVGRYYETMAFEAQPIKNEKGDIIYYDADAFKDVEFDSEWTIDDCNFETDKQANEMHDKVVEELIKKLRSNYGRKRKILL